MFAASETDAFGLPFGGKITNTKAYEVEALEDANFNCQVMESSFSITPKGSTSTVSYLKPIGVMSKTNTSVRSNLWVLGKYTPAAGIVNCTYQGYPPIDVTVTLGSISLFGTSKF